MSSIIDNIKTAYKILFTLQFELEGCPDNINPYVNVVPDDDTEARYSTYRILSKKGTSATVLLIETEPEGVDRGVPEMMPENDERFRFQVKIRKEFLNRTHLSSYDFSENVLYASNTVNNVVDGNILLTLPLHSYSASDTYAPGHIVQTASLFYRAVQASSGTDPHAVSETTHWKEIDSQAFISQADLRARTSLSDPVDLDTILLVEIFHRETLAPDYKLFDGLSKCREVIYKIRLHT